MRLIDVEQSQTAGQVLAIDESRRRVRHVISTAALDRANRIVDVGGWDLTAFRRNPVVLADHEYSIEKVIGTAMDTRVENDALVSTTEFASEGLGNIAFQLVRSGLAKSWSVGWRGIKAHYMDEAADDCAVCAAVVKSKKNDRSFFGRHYTAQELLEYSLVAIPANPDAVMGLARQGYIPRAEAVAFLDSPLSRPSPRMPVAVSLALDKAKRALRQDRAFRDAVAAHEWSFNPIKHEIENQIERTRANTDRMRGR